MYNIERTYIKIEDCKDRYLYKIGSRNLGYGVYDESRKGFIGIREKFGNRYLFCEYHYDKGEPYGTVTPFKEIELMPVDLLLRENDPVSCSSCHRLASFDEEEKTWNHEDTSRLCEDGGVVAYLYQPLFGWLSGREEAYSPVKLASEHWSNDPVTYECKPCGIEKIFTDPGRNYADISDWIESHNDQHLP